MTVMRIALLSPLARRTLSGAYHPWEQLISHLAQGLVNKGVDITIFARNKSAKKGKLHAVLSAESEENLSIETKKKSGIRA